MNDKLLKSIKSKGPESAIHQLNRQDDVLRALVAYDGLVRDLYWKEKNLPASIARLHAGWHSAGHASCFDVGP